jgi:Asp-tRNA(Asn)/Glu-tRNA(Gln) amidotransferase A subunit family amidase
MITKDTILVVAFERAHSRHPVSEQRRLFDLHDIAKIYRDLDLCVKQRRKGKGDVVAVKRLMLLADPNYARSKGGVRQSMREAVQAIEKAGATILELDTGRRRDDPAVREDMMLDAINDLSRTRRQHEVPGRPRRTWSAEQVRIMTGHWESNKHLTNEDAAAAVRADGVKATTSIIGKLLGKSGRPSGPKPRK